MFCSNCVLILFHRNVITTLLQWLVLILINSNVSICSKYEIDMSKSYEVMVSWKV